MIRSLGYVTVPTPGTPVRATANETDPTKRLPAQAVSFQVRASNTDLVYIGVAGMNKTTGVGVLAQLAAPADATTGPFPSYSPSIPNIPAGLNINDLWVDAEQANEGVVVGVAQA